MGIARCDDEMSKQHPVAVCSVPHTIFILLLNFNLSLGGGTADACALFVSWRGISLHLIFCVVESHHKARERVYAPLSHTLL